MGGEIVILKVGGSSITDKAREETLDQESLDWFASLVASAVDPSFLSGGMEREDDAQRKRQFVLVHGAGSFGHHSAKRHGLRCGKAAFLEERGNSKSVSIGEEGRRCQMEGLAKTRRSVQKLNAATVSTLIDHGVTAVGISPGVSFPGLRAHGATGLPKDTSPDEYAADDSPRGMLELCRSAKEALQAGLVPVIHGDACLLYDGVRGGILGGDTITEGLATLWKYVEDEPEKGISQVIFITDVAGVYSADPKVDGDEKLIRSITVDKETGELSIDSLAGEGGTGDDFDVKAGASSHAHDVTGGLAAKLGAAVAIVQGGIDVIISQCGSDSTKKFVRGGGSIWDVEAGTLLSQRR
ncbi:hypothetical protein ACHAXT_013259 [Thalassiosira profunda]